MDTRIYLSRESVARSRCLSRTEEVRIKTASTFEAVKWIAAVGLFVAFTVAAVLLPRQVLYSYLFLYTVLIVLFHKELSFKEMLKGARSGVWFWLVTGGLFAVLFLINKLNYYISFQLLAGTDTGTISIWMREEYWILALYGIIFVILEPLAENMVLRSALLSVKNRKLFPVFVFLSLAICGLLHAQGIVGIAEAMLLALPLTFVYLKTNNVYITLFAQIALACATKLPDLIYSAMRIALR